MQRGGQAAWRSGWRARNARRTDPGPNPSDCRRRSRPHGPTHRRRATATSRRCCSARDTVALNPYGLGVAPAASFTLGNAAFATTLPAICDTGRCYVRDRTGAVASTPLGFDSGGAWTFRLGVSRASDGGFELRGALRRVAHREESLALDEPQMLHSQGVLLHGGSFARFDHAGAWPLVAELRARPHMGVSEGELSALLESLYMLPRRPPIDLPVEKGVPRVTERRAEPTPCVTIHGDPSPWRGTHRRIEQDFLYGEHRIAAHEPRESIFDRASLTLHHRHRASEQRALTVLTAAGAKAEFVVGGRPVLAIHEKKLAQLIYELVSRGWRVEAEGAVYRAPRSTRATVRSGRDRVRLRHPRRGAGDQDRELGLGEGGASHPRAPSPRAHRHTDRESRRRALESVRVPESRYARRGDDVRRADAAVP
jgi:hypothetical protein